ncbi:MAG: hypothetical protein IIU47_10280, partial [Lachnospiraceae bacterium]|nr:hypothetical protein [Lachnospiraceae bacterium]
GEPILRQGVHFEPVSRQGVHFEPYGGFIVKRYSKIDENCGSKKKLVLLLFYYYWGVMNCTDLLRSALCAHSGLNYVLSENGAETAKTCRNPAIRKGEFIW